VADDEKQKDDAAEEKPKPKRTRKPAAKKPAAETEGAATEKREAAAEEKPKPKRKPAAKKPAAKKAEEAKAEDAKAEEAKAEEAKTEEADTAAADAPTAEATEEKPQSGGRRRGGAAAAGSSRRRQQRRSPDQDVTVRARARYVRCAPRKARLVIDHIRGKDIEQARAILMHTPRAASRDVLKLLESAIANAENNHELVADELRVGKAYVDEGPTLKRYRPRALGRATRIRKRTSHLTIELVSKE
jgi:ribosomal protein L22